MKIKGSIILFLVIVLTIISLQNVYAESGYCGDKIVYNENIKWELNDDGLLVIEGDGFMKSYFQYSDVPWYFIRDEIKEVRIGKGVKSLSLWSFRDCKNLEKVTLNEELEIIGGGAFYGCENLKEINIGKNVIDIGSYAFYGCKNLNTITNESPETSVVNDNSFETQAETNLKSKGKSTNIDFIRSTQANKYQFISID